MLLSISDAFVSQWTKSSGIDLLKNSTLAITCSHGVKVAHVHSFQVLRRLVLWPHHVMFILHLVHLL